MNRTPYGTLSLDLVYNLFVPQGFVVVGQEVRGTAKSGGIFLIFGQMKVMAQLILVHGLLLHSHGAMALFSTFGVSADDFPAFSAVYTLQTWLQSQYFFVWSMEYF